MCRQTCASRQQPTSAHSPLSSLLVNTNKHAFLTGEPLRRACQLASPAPATLVTSNPNPNPPAPVAPAPAQRKRLHGQLHAAGAGKRVQQARNAPPRGAGGRRPRQ